ncbi:MULTISPECIES: helix-turn-helix domain-containing protein [Enorma]|nr:MULTISPECIES: helix-turn-helix domain-containing protein [Enorma]
MAQKSFGATISALRKQKGMTQLDLARQMGVTDKAVSK